MSAEISWADAEPLRDDYLQRTDSVKVTIGSTQHTLEGLRFDKAHIQALLNRPNMTHLYLMFVNSPDNASNITLVAGALDDRQNNGGTLDTGLLYDRVESCPTNCPSNV